MFALRLCAFPRLNLSRVVHFGEVECSFTNGTRSRRQARSIKPPVSKVRIAGTITEDAITVAPFALVERLSFIRCRFLKHDSPHWTMVKITQREESHLGIIIHGSCLDGIPPRRSQLSEKPTSLDLPEAEPKLTIRADTFRSAEGPGEI